VWIRKIEDRYIYLPTRADVHLRYIDLPSSAEASIAESWVAASRSAYSSKTQDWIPRIMVRRKSDKAPLASNFIAIIEPYDNKSNIRQVHRLSLQGPDGLEWPDAHVAVEVQLADGRKDLFIAADDEKSLIEVRRKSAKMLDFQQICVSRGFSALLTARNIEI